MENREIINWLLDGDVAIQYQVQRDILSTDLPDLQKRISTEGWGAAFLSRRNDNGHWGRGFYQPKWISSHYTLLDLRRLCISPDQAQIRDTIHMIARDEKGHDGGVNPSGTINKSDICVNGMFLDYATYFRTDEKILKSVIDFILSQQLPDGGFNCHYNRSGAVHSSLHSTLSVLEGCVEYIRNGYTYRLEEIQKAALDCKEFILLHQFYISDRTGKIIKDEFLRLSYPDRWRYNILRALDCFRHAGYEWDDRMQPALDVLIKKRTKEGSWKVQAHHPGEVHFQMEKAGGISRWNTLRALRVLGFYPF